MSTTQFKEIVKRIHKLRADNVKNPDSERTHVKADELLLGVLNQGVSAKQGLQIAIEWEKLRKEVGFYYS